ncbi:FAD-binding oxidoreductase [Spirosoma arcticum]
MANQFFLDVKDIVPETPDAVTIQFWHPPNQKLAYQPGQFLTFLLNVNNQTVRRPYALSSSPDVDGLPAVPVKRLPGGLVSTYLWGHLKPGDRLETLGPMGTFFPRLDPTNNRTVVLIGAGSGIGPLFSIAKSMLAREPTSRVWLIYGNRSQESIIFKTHLDNLEQSYGSGRFRTTHLLSQSVANTAELVGYLDERALIHLLVELPAPERARAIFYICALEAVTHQARSVLSLFWIPTNQVFTESYRPQPSRL